jgi:hypothetical protein
MEGAASFPDMIAKAKSMTERCFSSDSPEECVMLDQTIREIDGVARRAIQQRMADDLLRIADKLDVGSRLNPEDEKSLELFAIGNAAHYVREENNVNDWKVEVRRLMNELQDHASIAESNLDRLLHLRALCRDAMGVLPELIHWMEEKDRITRFRDGANGQDPERGRTIARFIRDTLRTSRAGGG